MPTTAATVTNVQILALMRAAERAADTARVKLCQRALRGSSDARLECARLVDAPR